MVRRPGGTLKEATELADRMFAPPPTPEERAVEDAKANLAAMKALGGALQTVQTA